MMVDRRQNQSAEVAIPTSEQTSEQPTIEPTTEAAASEATPSSAPSATPVSNDALNRAFLATVQIIVPGLGVGEASAGSGSVLTKQGHILTNFHVIGGSRNRATL